MGLPRDRRARGRSGSETVVICATDVVEVGRQHVGSLASGDSEARLFDEDRCARREPCRVEPFPEEMQCLQEVDTHGRLSGCGAPKLTERETNQIVTVGLLDQHHTATPFARQFPGRRIASEQFGEYRRAVEDGVLCRGRIVDPR